MDSSHFVPGDPGLIENIVNYLKAKGIFDEFRHECLSDVDTKSSFQNLSQRVDGSTAKFLAAETWHPDMNKNELRNKLRRHIDDSGMLTAGADHVAEQVINPKVKQLLPRIMEVVHQYISEKTEQMNQKLDSTPATTPNSESNTNKSKPAVIDPIADILSFSRPKPKPFPQTPVQKSESSHTKNVEPTKVKKEDVSVPIKTTAEVTPKAERKREEIMIQVKIEKKREDLSKTPEAKMKKVIIVKKVEIPILDKLHMATQEELPDIKPVKDEPAESITDVSLFLANTEADSFPIKQDPEKASEQSRKTKTEATLDAKKVDVKAELIKTETLSIKEGGSSKSSSSRHRSDSDRERSHSRSQGSKASSHHSGDRHKHGESSDRSLKSSSSDRHPRSSSSSKHSSPHSKSSSSKLSSRSGEPLKSSDLKTSKNTTPTKSMSSKSDTHPRHRTHDRRSHGQSDSMRTDSKPHSSSERKDKNYKNYSCDSSQSSDVEKHYSSSKLKYYSKHQKIDRFPPEIDPDSKTHDDKKKHKTDEESTKTPTLVKKHTDASKITARSDSVGSTSSTSDSQAASDPNTTCSDSQAKSESLAIALQSTSDSQASDSHTSDSQVISELQISDSLSSDSQLEKIAEITSSEEITKTPKSVEKGKGANKKHCQDFQDFPSPPPPPPPSTSIAIDTSSSADISEHASSETENSESEDESVKSMGLKDVLSLPSSGGKVNSAFDVFLHSSSDSEFEGFESSPEKKKESPVKGSLSDVTVSSVHTSDISSSDDRSEAEVEEQEEEETSCVETNEDNVLKIKIVSPPKHISPEKNEQSPKLSNKQEESPNSSLQSSRLTLSSEGDISSPPGPLRESRRERKLNPKYASSDYASIFNSRRSSFLTKHGRSPHSNSSISPPEGQEPASSNRGSINMKRLRTTSANSNDSASDDRSPPKKRQNSLRSSILDTDRTNNTGRDSPSRTQRSRVASGHNNVNSVNRKLFESGNRYSRRNSPASESSPNENKRPFSDAKDVKENNKVTAHKQKSNNVFSKTGHI